MNGMLKRFKHFRANSWIRKHNQTVEEIALLFIGITFVTSSLLGVTVLVGPSMIPTVRESGELALINMSIDREGMFHIPYKKGDVVISVCPYDRRKTVCKRIVATEGDIIRIRKEGTPYVQYFMIPENKVWLAGDNIYNSTDSRQYGPVDISDLLGKIFFKFTLTENSLMCNFVPSQYPPPASPPPPPQNHSKGSNQRDLLLVDLPDITLRPPPAGTFLLTPNYEKAPTPEPINLFELNLPPPPHRRAFLPSLLDLVLDSIDTAYSSLSSSKESSSLEPISNPSPPSSPSNEEPSPPSNEEPSPDPPAQSPPSPAVQDSDLASISPSPSHSQSSS